MSVFLNSIKSNLAKVDIILVGFIFFLIFSPPIVPQINSALFVAVYAIIVILVKYKKEVFSVIKSSGMLRFCAIFAVFLVYIAVVTIVNYIIVGEHVQLMHYIKLWYRFFMIVPILMVCSLFICLRAKELKYTAYDLAMCFVYATMVQFLLVFIALIIPQVKSFFVSVIYANTGDVYLNTPWVMARRGFGFSNSFVDSFGFGMGIIAALPLFFIKEKRIKIVYFIPFLILVSFVNVRTGLIMAAIGLIISLPIIFSEFKRMKKADKKRMILSVAGALLILALLIGLVYICNPVTVNWVIGDVADMVESVVPGTEELIPEIETDSKTTTAEILFSDRFWNLPIGVTVLFGSGHTIYGAQGYPNSDVGYVNDLWLGGIIGCILLYAAFAVLFVKAFKSAREKSIKFLVVFFAVCLVVFQIKANAIMFNAGLNTILPLLFFICYSNKREETVCLPQIW